MFSAPYVNPSYQRTCRHYTPWQTCSHESRHSYTSSRQRSSSVPRALGLPRDTIARQQQRAEQRSEQRRLIRSAMGRVTPLAASREGTPEVLQQGPPPRRAGDMLVEDARRAAQRLRDRELDVEEQWLRDKLRQESELRRTQREQRNWVRAQQERWRRQAEQEEAEERRWRRRQLLSRASEPPEDWLSGGSRQSSVARSVHWAFD